MWDRGTLVGFALLLIVSISAPAHGGAPSVTVGYQPMVSTGLAAGHPFEAWLVLDKSPDPKIPGYAIPAGAVIKMTFPKEFTPLSGNPHLEAALLYGWPHGAIHVPFTIAQDGTDPRTVIVRINGNISNNTPEKPGLKAIHVGTGEINPTLPGNYPITIEFIDAGPLFGTTTTVASITANPVPNIAAYNQLHHSRNEDWQRVKPGAEAPLPIDFLVTLPNEARASITLAAGRNGAIRILSDGKKIGAITTRGVPVTLTPQAFGPGFARLGIVEVRAKAGSQSGTAEIIAALEGGSQSKITEIVE